MGRHPKKEPIVTVDSERVGQYMDIPDVQELANFFERRVSAYQVAVAGEVSF